MIKKLIFIFNGHGHLIITKNHIKPANNDNEVKLQLKFDKLNMKTILAIFVTLVILGFSCTDVQLPKVTDFLSQETPDEEVIEICTRNSDVRLNSSADIFCMLDPAANISLAEKCVVKCVADMQNMTYFGLLNGVAMLQTVERLFYDNELYMMNFFIIIPNCMNDNLIAVGMINNTQEYDRSYDGQCASSYAALQCLQDPLYVDKYIQKHSCNPLE